MFRNQWGNTYYFDQNGIAVSGFQLISGKKYYFGDDGTHFLRKNTWLNINGKQYYADINGVIVSGVQKIDSNYYFFNIELMPVNFFFRITVYFLSLLFIG